MSADGARPDGERPDGGAAEPVSTASSDELVGLLPHRPPFRFVDEVVDLVPLERITARYRVTGDEAFLAGHFPGNPIFPGVIQLEALAQTAAIALLSHERYAGKLPLFGGVEGVRWRRMVTPGDQLTMSVEMDRLTSRGGWGEGTVTVDDKPTCQGRLFFVIAPPS